MRYKLIIQPPAIADLEEAYLWIRDRTPEAAERWLDGFLAALETLERFPERCGLAPEDQYFDEEIRQLLYGKRSGTYRALFTIRGSEVHLLHIRHAARQPLRPEDL